MIRSNNLRAAIAAALAGLAAAPAFADDAALQKQVEALRAAMTEQRAQLEAQAKLLEAQQAQLEALTRQLAQPKVAAQEAPKVATQEAPKLSFTNNRPTITAADGRSSIAVRANVQMDGAMYGESPEGPLTTDFRRGSVGAPPNRETNAARDFSDGFYFRRARFGVEGTIARDFNYRLLLELGGSGTEGPTRINDAWIAYTGFAPFTFQLGAFSPPANMDDGTSPEDLLFLERASVFRAVALPGWRGWPHRPGCQGQWLALDERTHLDHAHRQRCRGIRHAVCGRCTRRFPGCHRPTTTTCTWARRVLTCSRPRTRARARLRAIRFVFATGPRFASTACASSTRARSTPRTPACTRWSSAATGRACTCRASTSGSTSSAARPAHSAIRTSRGYYLQGSWIFTGERRRYNATTGSFQNPRPMVPFSSSGGFGAFELAARYSHTESQFRGRHRGHGGGCRLGARRRAGRLDARPQLVSRIPTSR